MTLQESYKDMYIHIYILVRLIYFFQCHDLQCKVDKLRSLPFDSN